MHSERVSFDEVFLTPEYFADPYPLFHQLRAEAPVYWSERLQAWLVTRYDDVLQGLTDSRLISGGRIASILDRLPPGTQGQYSSLLTHMTQMMLFTDPPDHTRLRNLVGKAFTHRALTDLRPKIQLIVDELLDSFEGRDRIDLVAEFAFHVPAIVICEMLGIPREDRGHVHDWSDDIAGFISAGAVTPEKTEAAQRSVLTAKEYLLELAARRRSEPQDDLMTALVEAEHEGDKLSGDELISMVIQLFFAGFETTEGLIGNAVLALLRFPDQFELLRSEPSLIESAVEEFLRYDNSVMRQARVARVDLELRGRQIRKGQYVALFIGAANRDPEQFLEPDQLDITRRENKHVGFGHGLHFCIGGPLARIETQLAVNSILRRIPRMRLVDEDLEWDELVALRKLKSLQLAISE